MGWLQIFQLIVSLVTQVAPIVTKIGSLHTAINGTPGTPEHTAAVNDLNATAANAPGILPPTPTK